MGKEIRSYIVKPPQSRRGFFSNLIYDANSYTDNEMRLRFKILTLRAASAIEHKLLQTDESWFADDINLAFEIQNSKSWFLPVTYRPRTLITQDRFHTVLSSRKLSWPSLSVLRRQIADFLLQRTKLHPDHMLNEPIHFVYLDLMQILERLALSSDAEFISAQIPRISQYLLQVSSLVTNNDAADKLFIDNCRIHLNKIMNDEIATTLNSKQLQNILSQLQSALENLGEQYHTILHFSFMSKRVNAHPYWELFQVSTLPDDQQLFPTSIAQSCLSSTELQTYDDRTYYTKAIPSCPQLPLHPDLTDEQRELYFTNLQQLEELIHFKQMLLQIQKVMEQAGEILTIRMFHRDLLNLFDKIDSFFITTHHSMLALLRESQELYHQSIVQQHSLPWWQSLITNRKQLFDAYIINHEKLARYTITKQSLTERLELTTELLYKAINQLRSLETVENEMQLSSQEEVFKLISTIYNWRKHQYKTIGLPLPEEPQLQIQARNTLSEPREKQFLAPAAPKDRTATKSENLIVEHNMLTEEPRKFRPSISAYPSSPLPLTSTRPNLFFSQPQPPLLSNNNRPVNPAPASNTVSSNALLLGAAIPGFIILVLIVICLQKKKNKAHVNNNEIYKESMNPYL